MRVLAVSTVPPWLLTDGVALVLHHHLRELAARHDVTVLAAARTPQVPMPGDLGGLEPVAIEWLGPGVGPREYARRRFASVVTGEPADAFRVDFAALRSAIGHAMSVRRFDVVHLHGWGTARLAGFVRGIPTLHVAVDAWELGVRTQQALPPWRRALEVGQPRKVRRHEARHYPRIGGVVVVAPDDAALLRRRAPSARVHVVPNGVAPGPEPDVAGEEPLIGFHGTLSTIANCTAAIEIATEILPAIRAQHPAARAVLIGRDPPPEVTALAGTAVDVTGAVPSVRAELDRVAVYVAPMRVGTGIKNKVLEAMAAGRPVVATRAALGGIGAGPGIVVAETTRDIASAASALLADRCRAASIGAEGRARIVRDFSWSRAAGAIEALWHEVAGT